jgi:hypothetical protein
VAEVTDAEREVYELDKALAADGEDIVLRRVRGNSLATMSWVDVTCRAFVRGYRAEELVAGFTLQDSHVILSPTQIDAANWPGDAADSPPTIDDRIPRKNRGDLAFIASKKRSVEAGVGIYMGDTLVRIELRVLG